MSTTKKNKQLTNPPSNADNNYIAIMAGGIGSRFWPKSRQSLPKQFLDILGTGQTLIQMTYERFKKIVAEDHIYIVTGENYVDLVKEQLPTIQDFQIVAEPARRNTGPCVAYMAHKLYAINPQANFVVAPSDHLILEPQKFAEAINKGLDFANKYDKLVTLGIRPTRPDTGYGYIQFLEENKPAEGVHKVKTFTEKPSLEIARTLLESGDFLWNAGIFIWSVASIIKAFGDYQSEINDLFKAGYGRYNTALEAAFIANAYAQCKNISIDYAIMEYANNVCVIPASFGWSDLGTWTSLWEQSERDPLNNAAKGNVVFYDSTSCLAVGSKEKLIVIQGLEECCIVDTEDVLLICKLADEQKIKDINMDIKHLKGKVFS